MTQIYYHESKTFLEKMTERLNRLETECDRLHERARREEEAGDLDRAYALDARRRARESEQVGMCNVLRELGVTVKYDGATYELTCRGESR